MSLREEYEKETDKSYDVLLCRKVDDFFFTTEYVEYLEKRLLEAESKTVVYEDQDEETKKAFDKLAWVTRKENPKIESGFDITDKEYND